MTDEIETDRDIFVITARGRPFSINGSHIKVAQGYCVTTLERQYVPWRIINKINTMLFGCCHNVELYANSHST